MRLMRNMKWRRGVTDKVVARAWGLELMAVRQYSAEAWRRLKAEMVDTDQTAATVAIALERVIFEAAEKGLSGHRSIIEAGKTWASLAGAGAPTRIEVGALANLSDAELAQRREEIIARLRGEELPLPIEEPPEMAILREQEKLLEAAPPPVEQSKPEAHRPANCGNEQESEKEQEAHASGPLAKRSSA